MNMTGKMTGLLAVFLLSGPLLADGILAPKHGGRMVEAEGKRLELVSAEERFDLYVTDHGDKPVAMTGATARLLFLVGGQKSEVALRAVEGNRLSGAAKVPGATQAAVVMTVEGLPKRITARLPAGK